MAVEIGSRVEKRYLPEMKTLHPGVIFAAAKSRVSNFFETRTVNRAIQGGIRWGEEYRTTRGLEGRWSLEHRVEEHARRLYSEKPKQAAAFWREFSLRAQQSPTGYPSPRVMP